MYFRAPVPRFGSTSAEWQCSSEGCVFEVLTEVTKLCEVPNVLAHDAVSDDDTERGASLIHSGAALARRVAAPKPRSFRSDELTDRATAPPCAQSGEEPRDL